jgi:putative membrane protein
MKQMKTNFIKQLFSAAAALTIISIYPSCDNSKDHHDTKKEAQESNNAKIKADSIERDADFLVTAAEINLKEIKLGELAIEKGTLTEVREMGRMMKEQHTKSFNDLKTLAEKKSITIPMSITDKGQEAFDKLNGKPVSDFDKEYCDMMVKGHKEAISKFEKASTKCTDEDIRTWAAETLPLLHKHLDHALACQKNCDKK